MANPTLIGLEILGKCPCGVEVGPGDRQQIIFNPNEEKWNRMCLKCVNKGRVFSETSARVS